MTNKIEIPVDAKLNTQAVEQGAKRIDKALQDASKRKIDPIPDSAIRKVDALFKAYLQLDREMARRLKVTNQHGLGPDQVDWGPVYQNAKFRQAKLQQLQTFLSKGGAEFTPPGGGGGGGNSGWDTTKGMAANTAQAGLRAAGPVGNVAANALGTGMSAGFGAGLMGLVGGLAALGVGKLVGSITEKIEQAENNNIAFDRLKRTVGDVGVAFEAMKTAVMKTGEGLNITYDETERLASQFAKAGKVGRNGVSSMPEELGLGVGLSRAFGSDPSQGVGFLGQMRGVGVTRDTQDSRRMALLIGETIAKSEAFAKADEVMDAIAGFAVAQTRQSMSAANVAGYGGLFSSMVGSGIPGMDPSGAASIISRMNASLSAGGARGEASQFFTSMVGNRMGLDPLQMQVLREGGMFATKDKMFGVGSAYTRYMGQTGPTGSEDYYSATRSLIEEKYAGDSEQQKLMRAQAFANHTGLNMNQAMAMLSLQPNQMGEMQRYAGDMGKLSASGISNMGAALFGSDKDRADLARSFLGRDDVSAADKDRLNQAMTGGSIEQQKDVLAKLSAQYEQEKTMGSDIRDSRAALDNIKTKMADQVVPTLLDIKKGILYMAGVKDGKTPGQIMADVEKAESQDRQTKLRGEYDSKMKGIADERASIAAEKRQLGKDVSTGRIKPEEYAARMRELNDRTSELDSQSRGAKSSYDGAVSRERSGGGRGSGSVGDPAKANDAMDFFMKKGWSREQAAGIVANLSKESNLKPGAVGDGGKAYGIAQWHPDRQAAFARKFGKDIRESTVQEQMEFVHWEMTEGNERAAGDRLRKATTASDAGAIVSKYYERPKLREEEAAERGAMAESLYRTPMPQQKTASSGAGAGRGSAEAYAPLRISADPIVVRHEGPNGQQIRPDQTIQTRVSAPQPNTHAQ